MSGFDKYLEFQYRQSGSFYKKLWEAIHQADEDNLAKLAEGFPEEVEAYKLWTRQGAGALLSKVSAGHGLRRPLIDEYQLDGKYSCPTCLDALIRGGVCPVCGYTEPKRNKLQSGG